jgi:hypothetical protein
VDSARAVHAHVRLGLQLRPTLLPLKGGQHSVLPSLCRRRRCTSSSATGRCCCSGQCTLLCPLLLAATLLGDGTALGIRLPLLLRQFLLFPRHQVGLETTSGQVRGGQELEITEGPVVQGHTESAGEVTRGQGGRATWVVRRGTRATHRLLHWAPSLKCTAVSKHFPLRFSHQGLRVQLAQQPKTNTCTLLWETKRHQGYKRTQGGRPFGFIRVDLLLEEHMDDRGGTCE